MFRARCSCPAGPACVSILVVALTGMPAIAQTTVPAPPGALRPSIDDISSDPQGPDQKTPRPRRQISREPAPLSILGNPPASGAGTTGFDSTNAKRRRIQFTAPTSLGAPAPAPATIAEPIPLLPSPRTAIGLPPLPARLGEPPSPQPATASATASVLGVTPNPTPQVGVGVPDLAAPPSSAKPPRPGSAPPATATVDTITGTVPATPITPTTVAPPIDPLTGTVYGLALEPGVPPKPKKPATEDDPFDPIGIRAGTFVLKPAIEATTGYDTNPARASPGASPGPKASPLWIVAPELTVRSDWERHQLNADIHGSYSDYPQVALANRPNLDAKVDGRIDATRESHIDLEGRYLLSTDYPGSPNLPVNIAKLPIFTTVGATAGFTQAINRFEVTLKGTFDRTEFQDSKLVDGTTSSNKDRDYDQFGAQLRGSYELTPGVKPFAELDADARIHDLTVDRSGNMRDSEAFIPKIGTTFEISRKLTGEISVGYETRSFRDPTLVDLRALVTDASLVWTATGLTTVKLTAKTTADESVLPGVSTVLRRDAGIEVDHAFRRWLIGTLKFGYGLDDYVGSDRVDRRYAASAALTYKLTRTVQIKGELRQEWLRSNIPGTDYTATVALVGLRLQR